MLTKVADHLWVGDMEACVYPGPNPMRWSGLVHAAKNPCHLTAVGYKGSLPKDHPHYLSIVIGDHAVLNVVDAPIPIFREEIFTQAMDFIDKHIGQGDVAIHCNQGQSRAPAIATLYLAKRAKEIPDHSWALAKRIMKGRVPDFQPSEGLEMFLATNWEGLR